MKKTMMILLTMILMLSALPVQAGTTKIPARVRNAVNNCIDENGRCIVIDSSADRMYLFRKTKTGKWSLQESFRCVCGDGLRTDRHYFLLRSKDTDRRTVKSGNKSWEYEVTIDCYEEPECKKLHSYVSVKGKVKKDHKSNRFGICICTKNAKTVYEKYKNGTAVMFL